MSNSFNTSELYDDLIRRTQLLVSRKPRSRVKTVSIRLTELENNILDNLSDITRLSRSSVMIFSLRGAAITFAADEEARRAQELLQED